VINRIIRGALITTLLAGLTGGCTRIELESKAEAYNAAIAESTNELLLLNAVRASQRAPMSFTSLGEVSASPSVSGSAAGTFNFDPFGLTTYSLNPSASVSGGFSSFSMSNLNSQEFMKKIRVSVDPKLIQYFRDLKWPQELVGLMFIGSYEIRHEDYVRLEREAKAKCATPIDPDTASVCRLLDEDAAALAAEYCHPYPERAVLTLLNTGRELCGMGKFQLFLRRLIWVLKIDPFKTRYLPYQRRSSQGMLYYLGELIAAQNYSTKPYVPTIFTGTDAGIRRVPLFVVQRGLLARGGAAVRVSYNGDTFYIPQPELGSFEEAHSMQVLDFVSQVITAQTSSKDLPKVNTIGLIPVR
jgi:hypothetical protein